MPDNVASRGILNKIAASYKAISKIFAVYNEFQITYIQTPLKQISRKLFGYRKEHIILDYNVEDSSQAMDTLKILSIYDRLYLRKAKFMFKVYQHITPDYISEQFTLRNNVNTSVNLRSATACCFIPPKHRTEYYKHN